MNPLSFELITIKSTQQRVISFLTTKKKSRKTILLFGFKNLLLCVKQHLFYEDDNFFEKYYVFIILKISNLGNGIFHNPIYFEYKLLLLVSHFFKFDISHIFCGSGAITVIACSKVLSSSFLTTCILLCLVNILRCCLPCIVHRF